MSYREFNSNEVHGNNIMFPSVPFQMVILDRSYAQKYCLPYKVVLTVTHIRYSIRHKEIRYSIVNALFDFPWKDESCEVIAMYHTN